jgi:hypothetical protein
MVAGRWMGRYTLGHTDQRSRGSDRPGSAFEHFKSS